jgi:ABC-type transporter Mla subunit MlaD
MGPRREIVAIAAFAFTAAGLTAVGDYAFGLGDDFDALRLRMAAAFLIAAFILTAWRHVSRDPASDSPSLQAERSNPGSQMTPWIASELALASPDPSSRIRASSAPRDDGNLDGHAATEAPAEPRAAAPLADAAHPRIGDEISACNPIVRTLCDHVDGVVNNTEEVAIAIMTQSRKIDDAMNRLISFLARDPDPPIVEQAQVRLQDNARFLSEYAAARMAAMESARRQLFQLSGLAQRLDGAIQDAAGLSRPNGRLALHAGVEAAWREEADDGFSAASDVRTLSRQADDIGKRLQALRRAIADSLHALDERQGQERRDLSALASASGELEKDMRNLIGRQRSTLSKFLEESQNIAHFTTELNGSIQFQDVARQKLHGVTGVLYQLAEHSTLLATYVKSHGAEGRELDALFDSIVQLREVAAENSKIPHVPGSDCGHLELF